MTVAPRHTGPLLEIRGLKTHFFTRDGTVKAVDGVTFEIRVVDKEAAVRAIFGVKREPQ